jgi:hypothetical protein
MSALNFLKGVSGGYELQRIMALFSNLAGIIYAGCHLFINHAFSIIEFGVGMGSLNALIGGGIAMKDLGVAKSKAQPGTSTETTATKTTTTTSGEAG